MVHHEASNALLPLLRHLFPARKQHELRGKQCSHECNSIGRTQWLLLYWIDSLHVSLTNDSKSYVAACHLFSLIFLFASKLIFSFLGNAQSVASRNVWNGVSSELNAFHRNLLTTQVALQVELDFARNVVKRPQKKYSEVPTAGDAHLPSFPPNCYVKRLCSWMLHMLNTCLSLGGNHATLTLR